MSDNITSELTGVRVCFRAPECNVVKIPVPPGTESGASVKFTLEQVLSCSMVKAELEDPAGKLRFDEDICVYTQQSYADHSFWYPRCTLSRVHPRDRFEVDECKSTEVYEFTASVRRVV